MAIDVVFTIASILPLTIAAYKDQILEVLNEARFDKAKPIREAAVEAVGAVKNLPPHN
jgi:hypothetical protein